MDITIKRPDPECRYLRNLRPGECFLFKPDSSIVYMILLSASPNVLNLETLETLYMGPNTAVYPVKSELTIWWGEE